MRAWGGVGSTSGASRDIREVDVADNGRSSNAGDEIADGMPMLAAPTSASANARGSETELVLA